MHTQWQAQTTEKKNVSHNTQVRIITQLAVERPNEQETQSKQ